MNATFNTHTSYFQPTFEPCRNAPVNFINGDQSYVWGGVAE